MPPFKGRIKLPQTGIPIAFEAGESITYGLFNARERGTLFIGPGVKVYSGMIVGQSAKPEDIELNVCKTKKLTNTRSSSADEALRLVPPKIMSPSSASTTSIPMNFSRSPRPAYESVKRFLIRL